MRSLTATYWIANAMEMFERLAYYGLRTVIPIFMVLAVELGGPEFTHIQKATIFSVWAAVQSFVPVFSGGFADRFGYKKTIAVAIAIKIAGYLVMAFSVDAAASITGGASVGVPGHPATYWVFMVGAQLLALGTAIFKPGLQGVIATEISEKNDSLAWGLFYQLVNVGGFLGPILAGVMRLMDWKWVFVSCAVIVALNYVLLFLFDEPEKPADVAEGQIVDVLGKTIRGILQPRIFAFLAVFSGFWAMFHQLFDLLPNFIDDWVDSSGVLATATSLFGFDAPEAWGGHVPQEYMINLNAGMIMILAFLVGYVTGRVRSMTAMIAGIIVSALGILMLGMSANGWFILGAIAVFSLGEMMASPTKMRYFSSIAPAGEKGMYLGFINATNGVGWSLGSLIAGSMYEEGGDKVVLARRYLTDKQGLDAAWVDALPKTDVMPLLAERLGTDIDAARVVLWNTYQPYDIWTYFAGIGMISMLGLVVFDAITRRQLKREVDALALLTGAVTGLCYGAKFGVLFFVLTEIGGRVLHRPGAGATPPVSKAA